ncbi:hypothetical protein [Sphingomonas radiodurans]|uniref:hypothetical protein n=1 Tax=Sphingomonas radiodurans TaxID=2890321 RepID=UPI001E5D8609|nr:hypothetical protein [Sphingomonas radiodurans]WBH15206.1 hypothetical protein LLW23_10075 [Sphingomonas radiodurans]
MDDAAPPHDAAPRRSRIGPFVITVALVFAIGLALMWVGMRDGEGNGWLADSKAPSAQPSASVVTPQPAPVAPVAMAPAAPTDALTLATRESALAAQLAAIEARAAAIGGDVAASADRAGRAEAILVAFAARRAIERGTSLGYLEEQLRARFGQTQQRAVVTVIQAARDPVTIEALRQALDANSTVLLSTGADGWYEGLAREFRSLIVLHDANVPSPLPADRFARAQRMLDAGQVELALAEVGRLPGAAQATNWTAAAERYVAARRALDTLETAAIVGTIPVAVVPVVPTMAVPVLPPPPAG